MWPADDLALGILAEAAMLAALGMAAPAVAARERVAFVVLGLSLLLGFQNALSTRISGARVRTTHVTGAVTDIGMGLGMIMSAVCLHNATVDIPAWKARIRLQGRVLVAFVTGGTFGVVFYGFEGLRLLFVVAVALAIAALPAVVKGRGENAPEADQRSTMS